MGGIKKLNSYLPQYKSTFLSLGNIFKGKYIIKKYSGQAR